MQFIYTAKTASGEIQTGHVSAPDVEAVKRALREQSLFAIDVRKKGVESPLKALLGARDRAALSKRDLLSITTQLAIMTRSGVDLASAFQSLSQQCSNPHVRNILSQIHRDVTGGKPKRKSRERPDDAIAFAASSHRGLCLLSGRGFRTCSLRGFQCRFQLRQLGQR
jgi:type II secretory pathway component PulF